MRVELTYPDSVEVLTALDPRRVVLDPSEWNVSMMEMTPAQARELAAALVRRADEAESEE